MEANPPVMAVADMRFRCGGHLVTRPWWEKHRWKQKVTSMRISQKAPPSLLQLVQDKKGGFREGMEVHSPAMQDAGSGCCWDCCFLLRLVCGGRGKDWGRRKRLTGIYAFHGSTAGDSNQLESSLTAVIAERKNRRSEKCAAMGRRMAVRDHRSRPQRRVSLISGGAHSARDRDRDRDQRGCLRLPAIGGSSSAWMAHFGTGLSTATAIVGRFGIWSRGCTEQGHGRDGNQQGLAGIPLEAATEHRNQQ